MAALTPVSSSTTCMTVHCMYLDGRRTHPVPIGDRTAHVIVMRSQMQREEKTLLISLSSAMIVVRDLGMEPRP